jgi:hypothetical protein
MTNHHENFQAMMPSPRISSPMSEEKTSKQGKYFNSHFQQFKSEVNDID